MKLQLALDDIGLDVALGLLRKLGGHIDIIEIGTPLLMEYGMDAVRAVKGRFPEKEVLCDAKIVDGGALEANAAFRAGADCVTVLAVADDYTIMEVLSTAKDWRRNVTADLLCVSSLDERVAQLEALGVESLAVHVGVDQQRRGRTPLSDLMRLKRLARRSQIAVAGGIRASTLPEYLAERPDIIIVGGAILNAEDPVAEAGRICARIREAK
jgi:3-hexulose-6-phosphate synthase